METGGEKREALVTAAADVEDEESVAVEHTVLVIPKEPERGRERERKVK